MKMHYDNGTSPSRVTNARTSGNSNGCTSNHEFSTEADADVLLSRAMFNASLRDRNAVHEEIHGVQCLAINETPESVAKALNEFQIELEKGAFPDALKTTYHRIISKRRKAKEEILLARLNESGNHIMSHQKRIFLENSSSMFEKNLSYCLNHYAIDDPAFRLRFLRCELFVVRQAVIRYCNYLNFVYELWGSIALEREIRLSDFNRSESKLFRKGYFQLLPFRDRSGRRVVTLLGGMGPKVDPIARAKGIFYVLDAATRDSVESQKMGSILVMEGSCWEDGIDGSFQFPRQDLQLMNQITRSIPSRIICIHNCFPDALVFRFLAKIVTLHAVVGSMARLRLKFQVGDELEMRYNLKSLGIPIHLLARTDSGTIKMTNHNAWMKTRKHLEENENRKPGEDGFVVECPLTNDIVFRQGTPYWDNPGNSVFRDLIMDYWGKKQVLGEKHQRGTHDTFVTPEEDTHSFSSSDCNHCTGGSSVDAAIDNHQPSSKVESDRHLHFRDWVIEEVLNHRNGRFLEWDKGLKSFLVVTSLHKIQKKVSVSIYNCRKKASAVAHIRNIIISDWASPPNGVRHFPSNSGTSARCLPTLTPTNHHSSGPYNSESSGSSDDRAYQFLEEGPPSVLECCWQRQETDTHRNNPSRKRPRVGTTSRDFPFGFVKQSMIEKDSKSR